MCTHIPRKGFVFWCTPDKANNFEENVFGKKIFLKDETVISSQLNFANDLTLSAMNDVTLQAAKIEAEGNVTINAANNLAITTATESHQTSYELKDKGNYFSKNGNSGNVNTNIINTEITSNSGENSNLTFNVGNATVAQYNKSSGDNSSGTTRTGLDGSILYGDFSTNQNLSYLESLDSATTLYNPIEEINKSWDQTTRGLTAAGQAVVAITATALTAGAMDPVDGGVLQGFLVAGSSAAASTATVAIANSAVNADGDIFKQLKTISKDTWDTTTSKESVKNIVIAAAAGGLAVGLTNFTNTGSFTTSANTTSSISNNANTFERVSTNLKNSFQEVATQTLASTAAESAINGDSFTDAIKAQGKNILIYTVAKVGANEIGRAYHGTQTTLIDSSGKPLTNLDGSVMTSPQISKATQLTLHAGLGCMIAGAGGNNCASGAVGGVIGESIGELVYNNGNSNNSGIGKKSIIDVGQISGALSAVMISGPDDANSVFAGSQVGRNAVENNLISYQAHEVVVKADLFEKIGLKRLEQDINIVEEWLGFNASARVSELNIYIETSEYHLSFRIVPENQELWKHNDNFKNVTANGKVYATIGGGPDYGLSEFFITRELPNLHSAINRPNDIDLSTKVLTTQISPSAVGDEDAMIRKLLSLSQNYETNLNNNRDNLNYWFFPTKDNSFYNSNSLISGLGQAANLPLPQIPLTVPGYDKPVPPSYFANPQ